MQRCPKCNRTYQDETQKFCTFDGGRLMIDAQAPTTLDLGPAPQTDPLGATVMGPAPDLSRTIASNQPPLTSEIPPTAQTGPTSPAPPTWSEAPTISQPPSPEGSTTSPLSRPPSEASQSTSAAYSVPAPSMGSGSSNNATSAGVGAPPAPQTGPVTMPSAPLTAPPPKSNRILLVVGGLAVLLLLVIAGGAGFYFFAMKPKQETSSNSVSGIDREAGTSANSNANTSNANTGATASQPPVEAPPNATKFVNSRDKLSGSLAEHALNFSLYYPNNWAVDPKAGTSGSSNFFKANRMLSDDTGDYLLESAAVSWYQSNGTMQLDRSIFPNRVEFFNNLFSKDYPNYQKVSEGETKFNGLDAYQFTFNSLVKGTGKGDINLWGRVIFLPVGNENARNGVVLLMLASSAAPEIKSAGDVGEKGELPTILKTFRLGSSQ